MSELRACLLAARRSACVALLAQLDSEVVGSALQGASSRVIATQPPDCVCVVSGRTSLSVLGVVAPAFIGALLIDGRFESRWLTAPAFAGRELNTKLITYETWVRLAGVCSPNRRLSSK